MVLIFILGSSLLHRFSNYLTLLCLEHQSFLLSQYNTFSLPGTFCKEHSATRFHGHYKRTSLGVRTHDVDGRKSCVKSCKDDPECFAVTIGPLDTGFCHMYNKAGVVDSPEVTNFAGSDWTSYICRGKLYAQKILKFAGTHRNGERIYHDPKKTPNALVT